MDAADKTNSDSKLDDSGDEGSQSDDNSETKDKYDAPDVKDEENIEQQDGAEFAVASDVHFQLWQLHDMLSDIPGHTSETNWVPFLVRVKPIKPVLLLQSLCHLHTPRALSG